MVGTAATPGALILLGGFALLYWALFTPSGVLARWANAPTLPTTDGGVPNVPDVPNNPVPGKPAGWVKTAYAAGIKPPMANISGRTYAEQKAAFMAALDFYEGGPNSVSRSGAYGNYQIMPANWRSWSLHYFGRILPKTPANSQLLASKRIDDYYKSMTNRIARGELPNDGLIWTRIAASWSRGPSMGKRADWRDWSQHGYVYATHVILKMNQYLAVQRA